MNLNGVFFVYVDWTLETIPRPFYVGKGKFTRVHKRTRNVYWQSIAAKYGCRREIVLGTKDELFAFEEEKRRIAELGTFENGTPGRWGANFTEGGEGQSGRKGELSSRYGTKHTESTIEKCRIASTGANNPNYGKAWSEEILQRMRDSSWLRGKQGILHPSYGKRWFDSSEGRERFTREHSGVKSHMYGRKPPKETIEKRRAKLSGENNASAKLTWEIVNEIRERYALGNETQRSLATTFSVTQTTINHILCYRTWNKNEILHKKN